MANLGTIGNRNEDTGLYKIVTPEGGQLQSTKLTNEAIAPGDVVVTVQTDSAHSFCLGRFVNDNRAEQSNEAAQRIGTTASTSKVAPVALGTQSRFDDKRFGYTQGRVFSEETEKLVDLEFQVTQTWAQSAAYELIDNVFTVTITDTPTEAGSSSANIQVFQSGVGVDGGVDYIWNYTLTSDVSPRDNQRASIALNGDNVLGPVAFHPNAYTDSSISPHWTEIQHTAQEDCTVLISYQGAMVKNMQQTPHTAYNCTVSLSPASSADISKTLRNEYTQVFTRSEITALLSSTVPDQYGSITALPEIWTNVQQSFKCGVHSDFVHQAQFALPEFIYPVEVSKIPVVVGIESNLIISPDTMAPITSGAQTGTEFSMIAGQSLSVCLVRDQSLDCDYLSYDFRDVGPVAQKVRRRAYDEQLRSCTVTLTVTT